MLGQALQIAFILYFLQIRHVMKEDNLECQFVCIGIGAGNITAISSKLYPPLWLHAQSLRSHEVDRGIWLLLRDHVLQ